MKIALLMPDSKSWLGGARSQIYVQHLEQLGHQATVIPLKREQFPGGLDQFDVVFNHALQADPVKLRRQAKTSCWHDFIHVNHSAMGHIERADPKYCERISTIIHAVRDEPNIWYASVDEPVIGIAAGLERVLHMPNPMPERTPRPYRPPGQTPVIALVGRADPIKNQLNQLIALATLENIQIHLCMDVPPWMRSMLHALGVKAFCPGIMEHSKWLEYLSTTPDVLLQCSYAESFNNVSLEGMQIGLPVVTSPAIRFGLRELQTDPNDPIAIAQAIRSAIENHQPLSEKAIETSKKVSQQSVERFDNALNTIQEKGSRFYPRPLPAVAVPTHGKRAIALVAGDINCQLVLEQTMPTIERYAKEVEAEIIVLEEQPFSDYPIGNKWLVTSVSQQFDRTLYLDCDVWISPETPDIFAHVPEHLFAAYDEFPSVREEWARWQMDLVARSQQVNVRTDTMINGGVLLFTKETAGFYRPPQYTAPKLHTLDQAYLTITMLKQGYEYFSLDAKWNWTFVRPDFWTGLQDAYFVHLAGARPVDYRIEVLQRFNRGDFSRIDPGLEIECVKDWV